MKEYNKPADELLEAIKRWYEHTEGRTLKPKQLLAKATEVLQERLKI
jgi:hypothetical protein